MMRVDHDYERGGALAYLAAYDVHHARVFGRCASSTGIAPFMALAEQVMTTEPYASAKRVFWTWTTAPPTAAKSAIDRLANRFPNAVMVHTPVHVSWLNAKCCPPTTSPTSPKSSSGWSRFDPTG